MIINFEIINSYDEIRFERIVAKEVVLGRLEVTWMVLGVVVEQSKINWRQCTRVKVSKCGDKHDMISTAVWIL